MPPWSKRHPQMSLTQTRIPDKFFNQGKKPRQRQERKEDTRQCLQRGPQHPQASPLSASVQPSKDLSQCPHPKPQAHSMDLTEVSRHERVVAAKPNKSLACVIRQCGASLTTAIASSPNTKTSRVTTPCCYNMQIIYRFEKSLVIQTTPKADHHNNMQVLD